MGHLTDLARLIVAVFVGVMLAILVFIAISRSPGHDDIFQRQQMIEDQLRYMSCLLLIEPADRIPDAVAACQVTPPE
jgi:hypothetical protein